VKGKMDAHPASSAMVALSKEVNLLELHNRKRQPDWHFAAKKSDLKRRRIGLILLTFSTNDESRIES
jgi:hypothetical protein